MRTSLLLAAAAIALAAALVVPAADVLAPGVRSLHEDLVDGEFKPLEGSPFDPVEGAGVEGPDPSEFGELAGGVYGESEGNYLSQPGNLPAQWRMDRDATASELTIDYVFDPALGAMKRLKAYDVVGAGNVLEVDDTRLETARRTPGLAYDKTFVGKFTVRLSPDGPTPIYSPGPDANPIEVATSVAVPGGVRIYKDGADTFYARAGDATFEGLVELTIKYEAPLSYYTLTVPPGLTLGAYPARPALDAALQARAERVLGTLGLDGERRVDRIVDTLKAYFESFGEGPIPPESEYADVYEAIAYGENGCCRHRAYAFMVTAQAAGIPTRTVVNEAHAFVEVYVPTKGWMQINLGGCGDYAVNNPDGHAAMLSTAGDPGTSSRETAAPAGAIPTETTLTAWSPDVRKGTPFEVRGRVVEASSKGVSGMRVDVFVNRTKTDPGALVGRGLTAADGTFRIEAEIGRDTPAASYQLVAHARDLVDARGAWRGSWSDPEIRVETATHFVLDVPEADGADLAVPLKARLLDALDGPVAGARVRLLIDDATFDEATTDAAGGVVFEPFFHSRGVHRLLFDYAGDSYHDATQARRTIEIVDTSLDVPRALRGVRGEKVVLEGHVLRDGVGIPGRDVLVALPFEASAEGDVLASSAGGFVVRTDSSGAFTLAFTARPSAAAGMHEVLVEERELGLRRTSSLRLDVRTELDIQLLRNDTRALVRLLDDAGTPLPRQPLTVSFDGVATEDQTDTLGAVAVELGPSAPGEHAVRARFDGAGFWLPVEDEAVFAVRAPPTKVDPRVAAVVLLALASAAAAVALASRWGLRPRLVAWWAARRTRQGTRLAVTFPGLEADVPPVVAPGEPFVVRVAALRPDGKPLSDASVGVSVAGANVRVRTDARGVGELRLPGRPAGVVEIRASHGGGSVRAVVRVAEYRRALEETWHQLVDNVARHGVAVDRTTTPRAFEVEVRGKADPRVVGSLVGLVEVNGFSRRPIGRREFVAFARAARAVEVRVEGDGDAPRA